MKEWVVGTPLEKTARAAYRALRDAAAQFAPADRGTLYDTQTAGVMKRVLERRSNCVDVGCHLGAILDQILRIAPEGEHYGFEPLPNFYSAAVRKYAGA